jgi:hypothetical protein
MECAFEHSHSHLATFAPGMALARAIARDDFSRKVDSAMRASLGQLLVINLLLQLFDGLASYQILAAGVPEENPVVAGAIANWGLFEGLLVSKGFACALLLVIFSLRHKVEFLVTRGLTALALVYSCLGVYLTLKLASIFI